MVTNAAFFRRLVALKEMSQVSGVRNADSATSSGSTSPMIKLWSPPQSARIPFRMPADFAQGDGRAQWPRRQKPAAICTAAAVLG